ncbi:hypothetical protein [Lactococcus lactis]|uniref:hypothetical protein n=1 Tax=Lactococcus lactis TaxID=1358 RepID=UPI0024171893|nr:hypothetical protein [Lactococcus lactis]MDG4957485.1 hypothetical protein [Lactococcus lactis]
MHLTNSVYLAADALTQDSILDKVKTAMDITSYVGVGLSVLVGVVALVISLVASERQKEQWYGRAKMAVFICVCIVLFPQIVKMALHIIGKDDYYKMQGMIAPHVQRLSMAVSMIKDKFIG